MRILLELWSIGVNLDLLRWTEGVGLVYFGFHLWAWNQSMSVEFMARGGR